SLQTSDSMRAAAFRWMVGYRSSPNIVARGRYPDASRSPGSRINRVVPNIRSTMANRSSRVRYVTAWSEGTAEEVSPLEVPQTGERVGVLAHHLVGQCQHSLTPFRILDAAQHGQAGHLFPGAVRAGCLGAKPLHPLRSQSQVQSHARYATIDGPTKGTKLALRHTAAAAAVLSSPTRDRCFGQLASGIPPLGRAAVGRERICGPGQVGAASSPQRPPPPM